MAHFYGCIPLASRFCADISGVFRVLVGVQSPEDRVLPDYENVGDGSGLPVYVSAGYDRNSCLMCFI